MKRLDLSNKRLREANIAKVYISSVGDTMLEYYRVFAKQIKPHPPELELSDFYQPLEKQKNGKLSSIALRSGIATYAPYKYFK